MLGGLELRRLLSTAPPDRSLAAAALAAVSYGVWDVLDGASGAASSARSSRSAAASGWRLVYVGAARLLRIAELEQIIRLLRRS